MRRLSQAQNDIRVYKKMERQRHAPPKIVGEPLEWWRTNAASLPYLARLARKLLCIPATSASTERIFSSAGLTITRLRARLTPDNASNILFLAGAYEKVKEFDDERERNAAQRQRFSPVKKLRVK